MLQFTNNIGMISAEDFENNVLGLYLKLHEVLTRNMKNILLKEFVNEEFNDVNAKDFIKELFETERILNQKYEKDESKKTVKLF